MREEERPWWSSDGDGDDPSETARAADPGANRGDAGHGSGPDPSEHDPDICGVCPICIGGRMLQDSRPELYAHLSEAARHLAAAVRTLLDTDVQQAPTGSAPDDRVTRIDLD